MYMKLLLLFLFLQMESGQSNLDIGILGGDKSLKCSNDIGRLELTTEFTFSSKEDLNSYFLLYFKDSMNKKRLSICHLSLLKNSIQNGTESQEDPNSSNPGSNPSQSETDPSQSGTDPSKGTDPSQSGTDPSKGTDPSQSGTDPSKGTDPSQSGTDPSQSGTEPSKIIDPSKDGPSIGTVPSGDPSQSGEEPKSSQNQTANSDPLEKEIDDALEYLVEKFEEDMKKLFDNPEFQKIFGNLSNIVGDEMNDKLKSFFKDIKEKFSPFINISLKDIATKENIEKLMENYGLGNFGDLIDKVTPEIKKIFEEVSSIPYVSELINTSNIASEFLAFLSQENKNELYEKVANVADKIMTKIITKNVDFLKDTVKILKEGRNANPEEIIEKLREKIKNETNIFQNFFQNMPQFIKDNVDPKYLNFIESLKDEALNNLPSLIEDKINNPELSNILRAFSTLFNDSILNISIHTFANALENYIKKSNVTELESVFKRLTDKTLGKFKEAAKNLNLTLFNDLVKKLETANGQVQDGFLGRLDITKLFEQNFSNLSPTTLIKNGIDGIINLTIGNLENILLSLGNKDKKTNGIISTALKDTIGLSFKAVDTVLGQTFSLFGLLVPKVKGRNIEEKSTLLTQLIEQLQAANPGITKLLESEKIENTIQEIKNKSTEIKAVFDAIQTQIENSLFGLVDKITNEDNTPIQGKISNLLNEISTQLNNMKQLKENKGSLLRGFVEQIGEKFTNLFPFDLKAFENLYDNFLEALGQSGKDIEYSLDEQDIPLKSVVTPVNTLTAQIQEEDPEFDLLSTIQKSFEAIVGFFGAQTNNFDIKQLPTIFNLLLSEITQTEFYSKIEFYLTDIKTQLQKLNSELMLRALLNVGPEKLEKSIPEIETTLMKSKDNIVADMKNQTFWEKKKNEIEENIITFFENLFNITAIAERADNLLSKIPYVNQIYEKIFNGTNLEEVITDMNIFDITNITRIFELISNIRNNLIKNETKLAEQLITMYKIGNLKDTFINILQGNLTEALENLQEVLPVTKVGDIPKVFVDFINQLTQNFDDTFGINLNNITIDNLFFLNGEFGSVLSKVKEVLEKNEIMKEIIEKIEEIKEMIGAYFNDSDNMGSPFYDAYWFFYDLFNSTYNAIKDMNFSNIQDLIEGFQDDEEQMNNLKSLYDKLDYLLDKYFFNNKIAQYITNELNNENLNGTVHLALSIIKIVESFKTGDTNSSMALLIQSLNELNTSEVLNVLSESLTKYINYLLDLFQKLRDRLNKKDGEQTQDIPEIDDQPNTLPHHTPELDRITYKAVIDFSPHIDDDDIPGDDPRPLSFLGRRMERRQKIRFLLLSEIGEFFKNIREMLKEFRTNFIMPIITVPNLDRAEIILNNVRNNITEFIEKMNGKDAIEILNELVSNGTKIIFKKIVESELMGKISEFLFGQLVNSSIAEAWAEKLPIFRNISEFLNDLNNTVYSDGIIDLVSLIRNLTTFNDVLKVSNIASAIFSTALNKADFKIFEGVMNLVVKILNSTKTNNLRILTANSKEEKTKKNKRNRRAEETATLMCKMDETFSENDILTADTENLNTYILKTNLDYSLNIKSLISIGVDSSNTDKCVDNDEIVDQNFDFDSISDLKVETPKRRFTFGIAIGMSPDYKIPDFFYLLITAKMVLKENTLRFLDIEEDVNSYCLLEDKTDPSKVKFNCFGYSDSINENSEISLSDFSSKNIKNIPKNLTLAKEPKATDEPVPPTDDINNYNKNAYYSRSGSSGLSGGAIAGIIIACVAVAGIATAAAVYFTKKKKSNNSYDISDSVHKLDLPNNKV